MRHKDFDEQLACGTDAMHSVPGAAPKIAVLVHAAKPSSWMSSASHFWDGLAPPVERNTTACLSDRGVGDNESDGRLIGVIFRTVRLTLSSGSATEFSIVSQSLAMRSGNRCCLHLYPRELYAFCADFI
jgi:hypothetical protein